DLVTGPYTVADAMAAGKKAAAVIDRYLRGEALGGRPGVKLPEVFLEPAGGREEDREDLPRAEPSTIPAEARAKNFAEVEMALSVEEATAEARRCLRCDLAFTQSVETGEGHCVATEGKRA
ncbi:MAG TPA: hypothetical protein VMY37_25520, partial [Thermoguttaceae bacterium]|nr:hypothetical protein [Thermoguttaceae bacterium]